MIKLIATDMDGTLLDDNKQLPKNFDNIVKRLFNKNIRFVISSGRSYCTLKKQFSEYLDDMTFICDNGAYVVDKGKLLSVSVLPKDTVKEAVRFCDKLGLTVLLCGKNGTWHNSRNDSQHQEIASYYVNQVKMEDLTLVDDDIFKIAVFEESGIENDGYCKLEERFGENFNVQLSGKYWTDIMNKGVTKGTALRTIENRIGVRYEETMAFGDGGNDISIVREAGTGVAMGNAGDNLKQIADFITTHVDEDGVKNALIKYGVI